MKNNLILLIASAALGLAACGDTTDTVDSSDFEAAVPSADTLEIAIDDTGEDEPAEGFDPSSFQEQAQEVAARINAAKDRLHAHIDDIKASVEPVEWTSESERAECRRWEQDRARYHARLTVCEVDLRATRYSFKLEGRGLDEGEEDFVLLSAGNGRILERRNGVTSLSGRLGYNFDNARALFDTEGPTGRIAIGYRRTNDARQLRVAVDEFQPTAESPVRSAYHNYLWVRGRGGRLTYTRVSDFLAPAAEGGYESGQDGLTEGGRVSLVWASADKARAAATVCGGTVGEQCLRVVRCYSAEGERASWEEIRENMSRGVSWDEVRCPAVDLDLEDVGEDLSDGVPSADNDEIPGPDVEEPEPSEFG
ncbi:MAG: hypothetical protein AAFY60_15485 [Myxococcota bacterium]